MTTLRLLRRWITRFRAQRWSREALLAIALTLAAAVFIAGALVGRDGSPNGKAPVATRGEPSR